MYDSTDINKACPTGWHVPTKTEIDAWVKAFSTKISNTRYPYPDTSNLQSATDTVKFAEMYNIPLNGGMSGTSPHGRGNYATLLYVKDSSNTYYPRLDLQKSTSESDQAWLNYSQGWNSSVG